LEEDVLKHSTPVTSTPPATELTFAPDGVSSRTGQGPQVAILLCTFHAERFLAEQLQSIHAQSWTSWKVWASDDGSTDQTQEILRTHREQWGDQRLHFQAGPCRGSTANFLSLACMREIDATYYAFCDQDDLWHLDKLERALKWLQTVPEEVPALYCSRTVLVDELNQTIGHSHLFEQPPGFRNALVQSIAGGNTMVFNRATRELLLTAGPSVEAITHDWWAYMLVTGCGGRVYYDPEPTLRYRQHGQNQFGSNVSIMEQLKRVRQLMHGRYRAWIDANLKALARVRHRLTPENQQVLDGVVSARSRWLGARLLGLRNCGLYRQSRLGQWGLWVAAVLNRF
jgi:glycosyltransferase involved in cell wall biosynthesis